MRVQAFAISVLVLGMLVLINVGCTTCPPGYRLTPSQYKDSQGNIFYSSKCQMDYSRFREYSTQAAECGSSSHELHDKYCDRIVSLLCVKGYFSGNVCLRGNIDLHNPDTWFDH